MNVFLCACLASVPCVPRVRMTDALVAQVVNNDEFSNYSDPSLWATSSVTNFSNLFRGSNANPDVSDWDVSSGLYFDGMFSGARKFNRSLQQWDFSSALSLTDFLRDADGYNRPLSIVAPNARHFDFLLRGASQMASDVRLVGATAGVSFAGVLQNATMFNAKLDLAPLEYATSVSALLQNAPVFNQQLSWSMLSVNASTADVLRGASAFQWSLGCWPDPPSYAPNCSTSTCANCAAVPAFVSSERRVVYTVSLALVLSSAFYYFVFVDDEQ